MRNQILGWLFLIIILVQIFSVTPIYDDLPKLIVRDGNLILESAVDKNITVHLRGKSWININDMDLLKMISDVRRRVNPAISKLNNGENSADLEVQIGNLRSEMFGDGGLERRIVQLENGTRIGFQNVRLRNALRRIRMLETKIDGLINKITEDNCRNSPCMNGGTCTDLYDSFMCKCPPNWEGRTCGEDVNECAQFAGTDLGCQNGAQCINTQGAYSCLCTAGWVGIHCTQRHADCLSSSTLELCGHGTCINTIAAPGYTCICDQGWKTNGITPACTVDIDECAEMKPPCASNCINLQGSFTCAPCRVGFTGNGYTCHDIDECAIDNGGCSSNPVVACINSYGSSHCGECPLGWTGNGKTCTRVEGDGCSRNICHPSARCREMSNIVVCSCPVGMAGDGVGPNGCTSVYVDPCLSRPCQNGGTCITNGTSYTCVCRPGGLAPNCRIPHDPCAGNPCLNGGICVIQGDARRYRCLCPTRYRGRICQTLQTRCGGVLTAFSGTLKYPASSTYEHNVRCAWLIRTNSTKVLNITFTNFNLESSNGCYFDWLQIHDGGNAGAQLIGRFCGTALPKDGNIISTHNMLYLWFRSDNSTSHDGFELSWESIDPVCGGEMQVKTHGTIASPGSPGNYPPNRDCQWHLIAPNSKRIQIMFFMMQLEAHEDCSYDYLAIYDGSSAESPLIQKYCNTSHPPPLLTPAHEVTLHFHSDSDNTDAGFQLHYTIVEGLPGCGGIYTASKGKFGSPIENSQYPHNLECDYLIKLPADNKIKLHFLQFELEHSFSCEFDFLEIYDGSTDQDPKVGRWCGSNLPRDYKSETNALLLKFKSDYSETNNGFQVEYDTVCGGNFKEPEGILTSPMYPSSYMKSRICEYIIDAPHGKAVTLSFLDFNVENGYGDLENTTHSNCAYDFVEIFEGVSTTSLYKFCGNRIPPNIISNSNLLTLKFTTDQTTESRGFKANYSFIDIGCGGIVKEPHMLIKPPMNRDNAETYEYNTHCEWVILAPLGFQIQLFWPSFQMEETTDCLYDYVEIYDNGTQHGGYVGRYCGSNKPPILVSSSNVVTIIFVSDDSESGEGFTATYNFLDGKKVCGGNFFSASGVISSPDYPAEYPAEKSCVWTITVPTGNQIELNVITFGLEKQPSCIYDYLEIRNGGREDSPLLGKYCGEDIPKRIPSFSNQIYLKFASDYSGTGAGFQIEWDGTTTGCGGQIATHRGTITSPNYPGPYNHNAQCDWRIVISKGSLINIIIPELLMETSTSCFYDYIEIYDGFGLSKHKIGRYCSSFNDIIHIRTTSNEALIRFVSDISYANKGFQLSFSTDCHNELTDLSGVIESPNFPNSYPDNLSCQWTIKGRTGTNIIVHFSHLELEHDIYLNAGESCINDYIEISEKHENRLQVVKKICEQPKGIFNFSSEAIVIKFTTDISDTDRGFRLEYQIEGCGEILHSPKGVIQSPDYPNRYPHGTDCQWIIEAEYGHTIELNVTDFDIEITLECAYDGLIVANGRNDLHKIALYCGKNSTHSTSIRSNGNTMFVRFYSDSSNTGRGFQATYRSVPSKCGGTFQNNEGVIHSPNYPKNYDQNLECQWLIQGSDATALDFIFSEFDLEQSTDCVKDYVAIYDGSEINPDNLILKHCGNTLPNTTSTRTTSNYMLVVLVTDDDYNTEYKGFVLEYNNVCGRKIHANDTGMLNMNYAYPVSRHLECIWTISADTGQHITFVTTHFEKSLVATVVAKFDSDCERGDINFYDGDSIESPLKSKYCNSFPEIVTSLGNVLTIKVDLQSISGFSGFYSVFANTCGGRLDSVTGKFSSPLYPDSYPVNIQCVWSIVTTPGNAMELNIEQMDIEKSDNCNEDYLEVREGGPTGKVLGVFCGNEPPSKVTGLSELWIKFNSNEDDVGKGFIARYNYAHHVDITGLNGTITSPRYPNLMSSFETYDWRVTVPRGNVISATFPNGRSEETNFISDQKIAIYDGYDETAVPLDVPIDSTSFISSTNVLYIMSSFPIFKIDWTALPKTALIGNSTNGTCNEMITIGNTPYVLYSPGYPFGYTEKLNCQWIFITEDRTFHPSLHLMAVDLEDSINCALDYVKISSSKDMLNWKELEKLCKIEQFNSIEYHGDPFLKVEFITDYSGNKTGFSGVITPLCGGELTAPSGTINGTNLNQTRRISMDCKWQIQVRRGREIKFEFEKMSLPKPNENACGTYVMIKNGGDDESPILGAGKYCDSEKLDIPITTSNKAFVKFKFDQIPYGSWVLRYEEVRDECDHHIILTQNSNTSIINSPNFPNIPNPHSECVWTILAPSGEHIQIKFDSLDLTKTPSCDKEYIEIRDGATELSRLLGVYCSQTNSIDSTGNAVRIKYFTDTTDPKTGFKATVSIGKCGGTYHDRDGMITSKNYPHVGGYPSNSICEYRIIRPSGAVINITFVDVHLPAGNCDTEDHLAVSAVIRIGDNSSELSNLPNICGSFTTPNTVVNSNEVVIRFQTFKQNILYRGFKITYVSSLHICGGYINAEEGVIATPGYPNGWFSVAICVWRITVPKGRRVRMELLDYDFPATNSQNFSQLLAGETRTGFFNDHRYMSNIGYYYSNIPQVIYSTDNYMVVSSWLASSAGHRGFKMRFTSNEPTICEGSFDAVNGSIKLPASNASFYCLYDIPSWGPNQTIAMKFTNVLFATKFIRLPCEFRPPISILNGLKSTLKLCTNTTDIILRSPYPETKLRLLQTANYKILSFNMTYKRHQCGGVVILNDPYRISIPILTNGSYGALDCAWHIKTIDDELFPFEIMGTVKMKLNCEKEYLSILHSPSGPHVGRYCGETVLTSVPVLNQAYIEYHTDDYQSDSNFNITVEEINECGDHLVKVPRTIRIGKEYKNNIACYWTVIANFGYHIGVEFVDRFYIEESKNCSKDVLKIYDFVEDDWKILNRACGRTTPPNFNTTGHKLGLQFKTDDAILGDGFTIKLSFNCGGIYRVSSKANVLTSPNYPENYSGNLKCNYTLVAPSPSNAILVRFKDLQIESLGKCRYDNITVYTYDTLNYNNLGTYCMAKTLSELRYKDRISIVFQTDGSSHHKGFLFEYILEECGGAITESQMISSPKKVLDSTYPSDLHCIWNITAPIGKQIVIKFEEFEIEISERCYYDYVQVYEGNKIIPVNRIASLCGNLTAKIPIITLSNNNGIVYFNSDLSNSGRGFTAWIFFKDQCDQKINLNTNSPSYDFDRFYGTNYQNDLNCNFIFEAPDGFNVHVEFEQFHVAACTNITKDLCSCDYFELRDGAGSFSELIDRFCGHDLPPSLTSTRSTLFTRFVTDSKTTSGGIKAKFSIVRSRCGQTSYKLEDTKGLTVESPRETYLPNLRCLWQISSSKYNIHIHFEKFDLQGPDANGNCTNDVVQIYSENSAWAYDNGLDNDVVVNGQQGATISASSEVIARYGEGRHQYCGNHTPVDYYAHSNTVYVKFISDSEIQKTGIKLIATPISGCFKNYTGTQGRILLNAYLDCEFYITAPENYTLSIYFHTLFALDEDCNMQALNIYDGNTNKLLKKNCGQLEASSSFFSETNNLKLTVRNNGIYGSYDATYVASTFGPGCGGRISNYGGIFTSPFYPMNARNDSDCRWDIEVPSNMKIALVFDVFDLGAKSTCRSDYLQIIEFEDSGEDVVRQYCGEDKPAIYRGRRNRVAVRFRKTVNFDGTGWVIKFGAIHDDTVLN